MIKSIIISGGGHSVFTFYGIIKQALQSKYIVYENLESLYGTSAGSLICLLIALNIETEVLDNYLINKPWQELFHLTFDSFMHLYETFGIFNNDIFVDIFSHLFAYKELDVNITFEEFYQYNNLDIHLYSTKLENLEYTDFNHLTTPKMKVLDAIHASCAVPFIFPPYKQDTAYYLDGSIMIDLPLEPALTKHDKEEVLVIKKFSESIVLKENPNLLDYMGFVFVNLIHKIIICNNQHIENFIVVKDNIVSLDDILQMASQKEKRNNAIQSGMDLFELYYGEKQEI
jgi:predicted acylesterase/phospholipase RssA